MIKLEFRNSSSAGKFLHHQVGVYCTQLYTGTGGLKHDQGTEYERESTGISTG